MIPGLMEHGVIMQWLPRSVVPPSSVALAGTPLT